MVKFPTSGWTKRQPVSGFLLKRRATLQNKWLLVYRMVGLE